MWNTQHLHQYQHAKRMTLRAQQAEQDFLADLAQYCSHALTLQTTLETHNVSTSLMEQYLDRARQSLHQLRMRSNRALTGNGWRRNPRYLPTFIPVVEGTVNTYDRNKSLHLHIAVGNLPAGYTDEELHNVYRGCWLQAECAADDVVLVPMWLKQEAGWFQYSKKEERQGRIDCVDHYNSQIPKHVLAKLEPRRQHQAIIRQPLQ